MADDKKPAPKPAVRKASAKKAATKPAPSSTPVRKTAAKSVTKKAKPRSARSPAAPKTAAQRSSAFTLRVRRDQIAVIEIDLPGESQNTLRAEFNAEFERLFATIDADKTLKGTIICSTKPGSFIAGADINMFDQAKTAKDIEQLSRNGQAGFARIAESKKPIVAAINGSCLGGGLELALACHARVCADNPRTALGVPEVMLGLLPGAGGTQRLPRLVGIATALDMMLSGRQIRPKSALKMGLVDEVVDAAVLESSAAQWVLNLAKSRSRTGRKAPLAARAQKLALEDNALGRRVLFDQARKQALKKSGGHYPAIPEIIDVVQTGYSKGLTAGYLAESEAFGLLAFSPVSQQLRNIFRATNELKKDTGVTDAKVKPRPIQRVAVLGGGLMGAGISVVTVAKADLDVRLKDRDAKGVANGIDYVRRFFDGRVRKKALSAVEANRQISRVTGATDYSGFKNVDLIVEAVFEDLDLKHQMVKDIEANCRPDTIFASNTSSLPITKIAAAAKRPQNVIGLHYFSPVEKMPLLEIIITDQTAPEVTTACVDFGKKQGKTVIVVRDGPGFYTTRVLAPFMNEAARILAEGVKIEDIDGALRRWGFPVGPITLLDEVGIDVGAKIAPVLEAAFGERMTPASASDVMLKDGRYGRKSKKGFYRYDTTHKGSKPVDQSVYKLLGINPTTEMPAQEIAERCALMMLNEAVYCLAEGILSNPRDGDIGAIFGLGFPPFRGGPFRYADALGAKNIVAKLDGYRRKYGERFAPAPMLLDLAKTGGTFYKA